MRETYCIEYHRKEERIGRIVVVLCPAERSALPDQCRHSSENRRHIVVSLQGICGLMPTYLFLLLQKSVPNKKYFVIYLLNFL